MSKKIGLSVFVLMLGGITLSGAVLSAEKFNSAAAMERLKKLREQSQIVVRGNVDESIRKNRESEADAQRKMNEAANKIQGRMEEMSDEAEKLLLEFDRYGEQFDLDVQKATNIDSHLLETMKKFNEMLDRSKLLGEEYYQKRKAEVEAKLKRYFDIYQEYHHEMIDIIKNHLRESGIEDPSK